jgi:hypothetical protein
VELVYLSALLKQSLLTLTFLMKKKHGLTETSKRLRMQKSLKAILLFSAPDFHCGS